MLFISIEYILYFLPVVLAGFYFLRSIGRHELSLGWLVLASLFFYGWWNPPYLILLLVSISLNYIFSRALVRSAARMGETPSPRRKFYLMSGIGVNLLLLGYYKYAGFFLSVAGVDIPLFEGIILPLGISFFTFQQIAFLVDIYQGKAREYNLLHFGLFVSFFPQLIAGPIVHHNEMMPQFSREFPRQPFVENLSAGLLIFIMGLFKKVVIADSVALVATPVFNAADAGEPVTFFFAWAGALAYTFQLYFDFSGYTDMAIGSACMFGIYLPQNFNSPYRARSITEFWQRWHMTLSRFFRDYIYIPLGGNRVSTGRLYLNLFLTMFLCGFWHGAGWTFIIFGSIHGIALCVNRLWLKWKDSLGTVLLPYRGSLVSSVVSWGLTSLCVMVSFVFFRSQTVSGALLLLKGLVSFSLPAGLEELEPAAFMLPLVDTLKDMNLWSKGYEGVFSSLILALAGFVLLMGICLFAPNSFNLFERLRHHELHPVDAVGLTVFCGIMAFVTVLWYINPQESPFLYFQF